MLVFGKPLVGTPAMLAQPLVALDLPSRVLVWEQDGTACVSYQEPEFVARRFSIPPRRSRTRRGDLSSSTEAPG